MTGGDPFRGATSSAPAELRQLISLGLLIVLGAVVIGLLAIAHVL